MSKVPVGVTNFIRLKLARLQAELSRNMYSEHGLEALMRAVFLEVCQRLMVVSYCMPGSPHCQVDSEILRSRSRARSLSLGWPSVMLRVHQSRSSSASDMNSSVTRTEWLAF